MDVQTIGARLKQARRQLAAREHRDVTQAEVGSAAGVSPVQVSRYESDLQEPSVGVVARLAAVLGVSPGWLAFGEVEGGDAVASPPSTPSDTERGARQAPLSAFRLAPDPRQSDAERRKSRKTGGER